MTVLYLVVWSIPKSSVPFNAFKHQHVSATYTGNLNQTNMSLTATLATKLKENMNKLAQEECGLFTRILKRLERQS